MILSCEKSLLTTSCISGIGGNLLGVLTGAALFLGVGEVINKIMKPNDPKTRSRNLHGTAAVLCVCGSLVYVSNKVHSSVIAGWLLTNIHICSILPFAEFYYRNGAFAIPNTTAAKITKTTLFTSFALGSLTSFILSFALKESKINLLSTYIAGNAVAYTVSLVAASCLRQTV